MPSFSPSARCRAGRLRTACLAAGLLLAPLAAGCAKAPEAWRAELRSEDPFERRLAAVALGHSGSEQDAPALVLALGDSNEEVRSAAQSALAQLGPAAVPALVTAALRLVGDAPGEAHLFSVFADIGSAAIPPLLVMLQSSADEGSAVVAVRVLARLAPESAQVLEALESAAHSADATQPGLRRAAREALVYVLLRHAAGPDEARAAQAKQRLMDEGSEALSGLIAVLRNESPELIETALPVLAALGPERLPHILSALAERNLKHIAAMERLVAALGPAALPPLLAILREPGHPDRVRAALALAGLGAEGLPAWPTLIALLDDPDLLVPSAAARTLGLLPPPDEATLDALYAAAWNKEEGVRRLLMPAIVRGLLAAWAQRGANAPARRAQLRALGAEAREELLFLRRGSDRTLAAQAAAALLALSAPEDG
ncbi:MAG: HEAT repeat domain-containing protein [Planctomycetota bacterium]